MTKGDLKAIQCIKLLHNQIHNFGGEWRVSKNKNPSSTIWLQSQIGNSKITIDKSVFSRGKRVGKNEFQLSMHWTLPRAWKRSISLVKQSMSIWSCLLQLLNCCISSSWKIIPCEKDLHWTLVLLAKKEWSFAGGGKDRERSMN